MLRTWLVKISPETGSPVGSTTLVPKGRTREVIGQTIANSVTRQKSAGETTGAWRRPLCSRPTRGSKSAQIRSPASGAYGIALLDDLATFIRSPIERLPHCLRGHSFQQIGEDIAWASRSQEKAPQEARFFFGPDQASTRCPEPAEVGYIRTRRR